MELFIIIYPKEQLQNALGGTNKLKTSDFILYGESIPQVENFKVGVDRHTCRAGL